MEVPTFDPAWPASWLRSHEADRIELLGEESRSGYAFAYRRRRDLALEAVRAVAEPGASVLDVAAGQGNLTLALAEQGYRVVWNDIRADLIPYVQAKHQSGEVSYLPGNIFDVSTDPVDVVLATEVIEHVAHPDRFLARLGELVRDGGHVVVTTPNGRYWRNPLPRFSDFEDTTAFEDVQFQPDADGHIFLLHPDEVHRLAHQAGLEVVGLSTFTNSLTNGHVKSGPLLRALPPRLVDGLERFTTGSGSIRHRVNVQMSVIFRRP